MTLILRRIGNVPSSCMLMLLAMIQLAAWSLNGAESQGMCDASQCTAGSKHHLSMGATIVGFDNKRIARAIKADRNVGAEGLTQGQHGFEIFEVEGHV